MITPQRRQRIEALLEQKQPDLQVLLDDVHDSRNISAVIRTCDAVGVLHFYYSRNSLDHVKTHRTVTQGAHRWLLKERIDYEKRAQFLRRKREEGMQILVTQLGEESRDFREIDYTLPTLLVLGNEKEGVSAEVAAEATHRVIIPMHGMVQSLNVSVAAALILYEAQRQRQAAGFYDRPQLDEARRQALMEEWIRRDSILRKSRGRIGQ
ncbi:RNA methyltransferase [Nitratifractor sp.]|uniref:RNA methyltransferase n=1 Tax=Nitratifractor sp. TaxID=2268144 RepID=UPI0025E58B08|nr:RNA methyltransferase [Nitratifractor sp.]